MEDSLARLDQYISARLRSQIERRFLAPIHAQARLDQVIHDPRFYQDPRRHVLLYSDHGIVHARDVARQLLQVLDVVPGLLIPGRDRNRLAFMQGYGVLLAYIHDMGMVDFSPFGRAMHPEFG